MKKVINVCSVKQTLPFGVEKETETKNKLFFGQTCQAKKNMKQEVMLK